MINAFDLFNRIVGKVDEKTFKNISKNVEMYLSPNLAIFVPSLDYCDYAITPQHTHPGYSFIYNFDSASTIKVKDNIKKSPFGNEACICAMSPEIPHEEIMEDQYKSYFAICIDADFYQSIFSNYYTVEEIIFDGKYFKADESILYAIKRFMIEYQNNLPGHNDMLNSLATEITHLLIRHCYNISNIETKISKKIEINQLISFLNSNYDKKITVDDMACFVKISPSHFSKIFKKETGFSPIDFLINLRVEKAKKSLINKGSNITEVAMNCGFSSSAYFAACFKERTGQNPSEYLKKSVLF